MFVCRCEWLCVLEYPRTKHLLSENTRLRNILKLTMELIVFLSFHRILPADTQIFVSERYCVCMCVFICVCVCVHMCVLCVGGLCVCVCVYGSIAVGLLVLGRQAGVTIIFFILSLWFDSFCFLPGAAAVSAFLLCLHLFFPTIITLHFLKEDLFLYHGHSPPLLWAGGYFELKLSPHYSSLHSKLMWVFY